MIISVQGHRSKIIGALQEMTISDFFSMKLTCNPPTAPGWNKKKPRGKGSL